MISDLLPEYYKAYGDDPVYKIIESRVIDGHEVAWMEFKGRSGKRKYSGRSLYCECDFIKGVGWDVKDSKDGRPYGLSGKEKCSKRKKTVRLRHLELQKEYLEMFKAGNNLLILHQHIPEIVDDLKNKVKAGEFLEDGNGASFWGGYFYLQTLAAIIDPSMNFWEMGDSLVRDKKISLEGAVVRDYQEPPPPSWQECFKIEKDGWIGTAFLPAHSKMKQVWEFSVSRLVDGKSIPYQKVPKLPLMHHPTFGPDVADVENAKRMLLQLIQKEIKKDNKRKKKK